MKGLSLFASLSLLACAACTGAVESSDPAPAPSTGPVASEPAPPAIDHVRAVGDEFATVGAPDPKPTTFFCRKDAFCEDFEEAAWQSRWLDTVVSDGARLETDQQSAASGKSALRLYARDESASAFLLRSQGEVAESWSGALTFAFRADAIPGKYLGGPELTVKTSDGPITIRVALTPEGVVLEQRATDACLKDRCAASSKIIAPAKEGHWYQIRIGFEVSPQASSPYGRVEAAVDGGDLQSMDLTVPFASGSVFLRAGLTQGDGRPAFAELDAVSLLVR